MVNSLLLSGKMHEDRTRFIFTRQNVDVVQDHPDTMAYEELIVPHEGEFEDVPPCSIPLAREHNRDVYNVEAKIENAKASSQVNFQSEGGNKIVSSNTEAHVDGMFTVRAQAEVTMETLTTGIKVSTEAVIDKVEKKSKYIYKSFTIFLHIYL